MAEIIKPENTRVCKTLTQERLKELLHYEPISGVFTWLVDIRSDGGRGRLNVVAGQTAGTLHHTGYVYIGIDGRSYQAHKLAVLYTDGILHPIVDHRDLVKSHNWRANLRPCARHLNHANFPRRKDNSSGTKGVSYDRRYEKWVARLQVSGKRKFLGHFNTPEEAAAKYAEAAVGTLGEFARLG